MNRWLTGFVIAGGPVNWSGADQKLYIRTMTTDQTATPALSPDETRKLLRGMLAELAVRHDGEGVLEILCVASARAGVPLTLGQVHELAGITL